MKGREGDGEWEKCDYLMGEGGGGLTEGRLLFEEIRYFASTSLELFFFANHRQRVPEELPILVEQGNI